MQLKVSAISDRGKLRAGNEDNIFVNGVSLPEVHTETYSVAKQFSTLGKPLFAVFDGMGGYEAGERASFLAAAATDRLAKPAFLRSKNLLPKICEAANQAVCQEMKLHKGTRMGTTAAMLLFSGSQYFLCNVGDSPIFLMREGTLLELSKEHTERAVYEAVTGKKSEPGRKFRLTQNLGIASEEVMLDPYYTEGALQIGDTFLICSDGVTDMLDQEQIAWILKRRDVSSMAETLWKSAMEAGGKDNITAIVIRCCA